MFETDLTSVAVASIIDETIDQVGASPRRWAVLLIVLLVGALGLMFLTRHAVTADSVLAPDPGGPA